MFFSAEAKGCNYLMLGLEKKAVIKAREEAQDWQTYDMNYNCVFLFCLGSENNNHTVHFATISSHAEPEQHEDVVSRKQHFLVYSWFGVG